MDAGPRYLEGTTVGSGRDIIGVRRDRIAMIIEQGKEIITRAKAEKILPDTITGATAALLVTISGYGEPLSEGQWRELLDSDDVELALLERTGAGEPGLLVRLGLRPRGAHLRASPLTEHRGGPPPHAGDFERVPADGRFLLLVGASARVDWLDGPFGR